MPVDSIEVPSLVVPEQIVPAERFAAAGKDKLSSTTFLIFLAATTRAWVIATHFGGFAHYRFGSCVMMIVTLATLVSVHVAINKAPFPMLVLAKTRDLVMFDFFTLLDVAGDELDFAFGIICRPSVRGKYL